MTMSVKSLVIEPACIQSKLQQIVPSEIRQLISWSCSPLGEGKEESSVYRVTCTIQLQDGSRGDYSLILKIAKPDSMRDKADHYFYWKREALVYQSGMLSQLPEGIRAPQCYGVEEQADGDVRLWLEDVPIETFQKDWSLAHMCKTFCLLGKFNGAYLTGASLPADGFLCRAWMRSWVEVCTAYAKPMEEQQAIWNIYKDVHNSSNELWEQYLSNRYRVSSLLETLDQLPRVLAHQDVHWDNIFLEKGNGDDSLIAIDWQFASISGVGEELGRMFGYALLQKKIPVNQAAEYKEELFSSYVEGLRAAGWEGDSKLVRFGFTVTASLRYIMVMDKLLRGLEEGSSNNEESNTSHLEAVTQELLHMAEEAWSLRSEITGCI
ncbi:phosphotransferase [Paenibacillus sp. NPDC057967]|uniref:phosphotransferase n=1 Tax=Paenibacillus sp. NPDC057967 TaxID=3346293 RepID=UPI0036DB517E